MGKYNLVETKTKYFFDKELKKSFEYTFRQKSIIINIVLFIVFFGTISIILYYRSKNKSVKPKTNDYQTQQYVLNKLRKFNKNELKSDLITNLPIYNNDYNPRLL